MHMPQWEEVAVVTGSSTGMVLEEKEESFIALFVDVSTRFS